jgi:predicted lipoprotein with Yx(FWY)xxD motif
MRKRRAALISGAVAVTSFFATGAGVAAAAAPSYGPAGTTGSSPAMKQTGPIVGATKSRTLHTVATVVNGRTETILSNAQGLPLYYYRADTAKKSLVSGELAVIWPPLVAAKPTATGLRGTIGALKNAHGQQVTYNGHFLYTFVDDTAGHVTGQGVSNFFVVTPRLKAITVVSTTGAAPVTSSGGRYGY